MAEGGESNYAKIPCSFLLHSTSQDGDLCSYMHAAATKNSNTDNVIMCQFYLKGKCRFGSNCEFSHSTSNDDRQLTIINDDQTSGPSCLQVDALSTSSLLRIDVNKPDICQPNIYVLNQSSTNMLPTYVPNSSYWMKAPEFVTKTMTSSVDNVKSNISQVKDESLKQNTNICSQFSTFENKNKDECQCVYVNLCEFCGKYYLNTCDEAENKMHREICEKKFEQDLNLSHTLQRSLKAICLLCKVIIMEKNLSERLFAILEKCNHVFCVPCIRKWCNDHWYYKFCPKCGVPFYFYTISQYLVGAEEKTKLISDYKVTMSKKPCKYFNGHKGSCHFGEVCLYLHANHDGAKAKLPSS